MVRATSCPPCAKSRLWPGFPASSGKQSIASVSSQTTSRPALLKQSLAAVPAASKVALASSAFIATVVSMFDRLLPPAAASMAEAAALSLGNSPITNQSCGPKVQVPTDEPTSDILEEI